MTAATVPVIAAPRRHGVAEFVARHPTVVFGGALLLAIVVASIVAPWLGTIDPVIIDPTQRLKSFSDAHWFGTDRFGRDLYSRVL